MLDHIDKKILKKLQQRDAATPKINAIAKQIGLSPATVYNRIKKLERIGAITGYSATVDAKKVGKGLTVFSLIKLEYPKSPEEIGFDEEVGKWIANIDPAIQEVHAMTGEWELLVKMKVKDQKEYYRIAKEMVKTGKILKVYGLFALNTIKEEHSVYP